ncbi:hypothetical protein Bca101_096070 [Brassica carinata]
MATRVWGAPHLSLWQDLKLQHCIQALWSMIFTRHSLACSSALISTVDLSSDVYDFFLGNQIWNHDALSPPPFQQLFLCRSSLLLRLFGSGLSPENPLAAAHTYECSFYRSLLDFTDHRLGVGSVKSPWLHYGNAGVGVFCLNSMLTLLESIVKPIYLSDVNMKSSEVRVSFFGAIFGVNSKFLSKVHHQRPTPTSASGYNDFSFMVAIVGGSDVIPEIIHHSISLC